MEMKDLSCAQFLAQLASKAPTPGGGGTAALAGAAGVALGVAFEAQRVPEAAADEQDRQLDGFVTERKVYRGTDEFEL